MYAMAGLLSPVLAWGLENCFGQKTFAAFGLAYAPLIKGTLVLGMLWLICFLLYRRKIFVKI
jgi:hypothetical protein